MEFSVPLALERYELKIFRNFKLVVVSGRAHMTKRHWNDCRTKTQQRAQIVLLVFCNRQIFWKLSRYLFMFFKKNIQLEFVRITTAVGVTEVLHHVFLLDHVEQTFESKVEIPVKFQTKTALKSCLFIPKQEVMTERERTE